MNKVKLNLSKPEVTALLGIIGASIAHGRSQGLTHAVACQILRRISLKLMGRYPSLKEKKNSLTLSLPEAWAFTVQVAGVRYMLGAYEQVLTDKISGEAHRVTS